MYIDLVLPAIILSAGNLKHETNCKAKSIFNNCGSLINAGYQLKTISSSTHQTHNSILSETINNPEVRENASKLIGSNFAERKQ